MCEAGDMGGIYSVSFGILHFTFYITSKSNLNMIGRFFLLFVCLNAIYGFNYPLVINVVSKYQIRSSSICMKDENSSNGNYDIKKRLGVLLTAARLGISIPGRNFMMDHASKSTTVATTALFASTLMSNPTSADASNGFNILQKKYSNLNSVAKLSTTPLVYVCNSGGHPYLQEDLQSGNPTQKIIVYFMSSEDASEYLNEMAQGNPYNVNEFRVMTTSMEKVMNKIKSKKQSRKIGRYEMSTIYRIQPSSLQCQHADELLNNKDSSSRKRKKDIENIATIPTFMAKGMLVERPTGEEMVPHYFAYEDLLRDWKELGIRGEPEVSVLDLADVMCLSEAQMEVNKNKGKDERRIVIGVVPPRGEIDLIKRYYRGWGSLRKDFQRSKIIGARR